MSDGKDQAHDHQADSHHHKLGVLNTMVIEVIRKAPPQHYTTICTDPTCRTELVFTQDDIKHNSTYYMGQEGGSYETIVCPLCDEVLKKKDFKKVNS